MGGAAGCGGAGVGVFDVVLGGMFQVMVKVLSRQFLQTLLTTSISALGALYLAYVCWRFTRPTRRRSWVSAYIAGSISVSVFVSAADISGVSP